MRRAGRRDGDVPDAFGDVRVSFVARRMCGGLAFLLITPYGALRAGLNVLTHHHTVIFSRPISLVVASSPAVVTTTVSLSCPRGGAMSS